VFLALAVPFCLRQDSEWELVYVRAADHLWKGEDVYRPEDGYLYPPFMAWAALPFRALPAPLLRGSWLLVNLLCLAALLRWSWRLARGPRLEGGPPAARAEHAAALLGAACGLPYLHNCLAHQQTDLVIGALLLGGCLLLGRGRSLRAATCLGLAAAIKCTPLLWAPYLVWRRRPAAAAWLVAVALGVNFLPDLVSTSPAGRPWLAEYGARYLRPLTAAGHVVGSWGSEIIYNQSLAGAGQRWLATSWEWGATTCTVQPRPAPVGPLALRGLVYAVGALLVSAAAWACGRPIRSARDEPGDAGGGETPVGRHGLECGVVLLLMLLLSPMSSKAHFGVLILPGFCLARAAPASRAPLPRGLLLAAVALAALGSKDPLGERLYTLTLWYGSVTWETLALLLGCLFVLRQDAGAAAGRLPGPAGEAGALPHAA
jgi:hypothetical protein